jgi:hypothetical protein
MFESFSLAEGLRDLSIGRIIYGVVLALPVAVSLSVWLDPSEDQFHNTLLLFLVLILDVPIVIVGIAILIWKKIKHESLLFWSVAVFIASTPIIGLVVMGATRDLMSLKTPQ